MRPLRSRNGMIYRAAVAGAAVLALIGAGPGIGADTLRSVAATYYAKAGRISTVTGRDTTMDYYQRLLDDADLLAAPRPASYPPQAWQDSVQAIARLDLSLATQLLSQSYQEMPAIRGLGETLVRSSLDGTLQPVAVYVPSTYSPEKPAPLAIFLHGRQESETQLIGPQFVREIAERTGTILVAPYGRGDYDFRGSESDVYDALDAAQRAFAVDEHRRYLAGYSMGAFSAFRLGPLHPEDWSAVMCIAGSLLASRASTLVSTMPRTRFYVLTGAKDDVVPTLWPTVTAIFLRDAGLAVTFYSQPDGTHSLRSLQDALAQAFGDMERDVVRLPTGLTGSADLPDFAGPRGP